MSLPPDTQRILLGPGPTLTSPRVMRAMASPVLRGALESALVKQGHHAHA